MGQNISYYSTTDLPQDLPLLLIKGAILLPQAQLSLPIFDKTQFSMIKNVLKSGRLVGIIQPNLVPDYAETIADVLLYTTGSVGKIIDIIESEDSEEGHMLLIVNGVCRFNLIDKYDSPSGYPMGRVNYDNFKPDLAYDTDLNIDRNRLLTALRPYFNNLDLTPNWDEINQISNQKLINALLMACPFDPKEKQALLESQTLTDQSNLMTTLIEMASFQSNHPSLAWH